MGTESRSKLDAVLSKYLTNVWQIHKTKTNMKREKKNKSNPAGGAYSTRRLSWIEGAYTSKRRIGAKGEGSTAGREGRGGKKRGEGTKSS